MRKCGIINSLQDLSTYACLEAKPVLQNQQSMNAIKDAEEVLKTIEAALISVSRQHTQNDQLHGLGRL